MLFFTKPNSEKQYINLYIALSLILSLHLQAIFLWAGTPDIYEPDNSFQEAKIVVVNPEVPGQHHTFHRYFDEDWFKFHAESNEYLINVTPNTYSSDPIIELYYMDGSTLLKSINNNGPGEGEILRWTCRENGYYFVRVRNNSAYFGTEVSYIVSISIDQNHPILFFYGFVQGKVSSNGTVLKGVVIEVGSGIGLSNADGSFAFSYDSGPVDVSFRKDGYYPKVLSVTVVASQTTQLDIELEKIPTPSKPPLISGIPKTLAILDKLYSFIPTASDPDGGRIAFSISNKPSWASFSPDNGMLVGVPTENDIGKYGPIVISVSNFQGTSTSLPSFTLEVKRIMFPSVLMLLDKEM